MTLYLANALIILLALPSSTLGWPTPEDIGSMKIGSLFGREDDFDPDDLSFIQRIAAIGDSYSAGIGAGDVLDGDGDSDCSRYDHSYPYLLQSDERLGDPTKRQFQFQSCSGAVVEDVVEKQLPEIDSDQQVILLSAGGNDAKLTHILNQCIFQIFTLTSYQASIAKLVALVEDVEWAKDLDFGAVSRTCEEQLDYSRAIIEGKDFSDSLDDMIEAAKEKLSSDGMIYYTGYAKFFSTDYGSACDKVTWSLWIHKLYNIWQPLARLTTSRRRDMNDLVDLMNEKLEEAVDRAGDKVTFVNYDEFVGHFNGRYCEDGVDEASVESNTRPMLMFYEFNTWDRGGTSPWKRSVSEHAQGSFAGDLNTWARAMEYVEEDAKHRNEHLIEDDIKAEAEADLISVTEGSDWVPNLIPDGYGRVFHPQVFLHGIIADLVLFHISNRNLEDNGHEALPLIEDAISSCSLDEPEEDEEDEEDEEEEPKLDKPDTSKNEKKCYNSGQKSSYGKIDAAAESFCKYNLETHEDGPVFSDFRESDKKTPPGSYHFAVTFEVFEGCEWEYDFDDCMRYFKVPMDSCDCSAKGNKQGGTVRNNCIYARIDPNYGV